MLSFYAFAFSSQHPRDKFWQKSQTPKYRFVQWDFLCARTCKDLMMHFIPLNCVIIPRYCQAVTFYWKFQTLAALVQPKLTARKRWASSMALICLIAKLSLLCHAKSPAFFTLLFSASYSGILSIMISLTKHQSDDPPECTEPSQRKCPGAIQIRTTWSLAFIHRPQKRYRKWKRGEKEQLGTLCASVQRRLFLVSPIPPSQFSTSVWPLSTLGRRSSSCIR